MQRSNINSGEKPMDSLKHSIQKNVLVEVKGNRNYSGVLEGYDVYMNLVLRNATEMINGEVKGTHDIVVVRGDNVIFISPGGDQ